MPRLMAIHLSALHTHTPQVAARLMKAMEDVVRLPESNKKMAIKELQKVMLLPNLSKEVYEIADKCLTSAMEGLTVA